MITGLAGIAVGPDAAFRWSLYLLLCAWPLSVYLGARLFGISRWGAAGAAALSPFLMSATGVGYEQKAYLWIGYGVWTQLWASVTLPLAWGFSWRAIRTGRHFLPAALAVSLTVALHFETGYLALLPLLLWPFVSWRSVGERGRRAALVLAGALVASAWVIVPLIAERNYAATNEILQRTPLVNGYGAGRVLGWLVSGQLLDAGRLPVMTYLPESASCWQLLAGEGMRLAARCSLSLGDAPVVFGRTTFGALIDVVPGHSDIFFRRFMMGAQLAALLLAGIGLAWCGRNVCYALQRFVARSVGEAAFWVEPATRVLGRGGCRGHCVVSPAWSQLLTFDRSNAAAIGAQRGYDQLLGSQIDHLIAIVKRDGGGRVYAGMPSNWGTTFRIGAVPVFKYLESRDLDEVGYTLRTASLMTDPEFYFDERNPSDYRLFGIRYLILPPAHSPPVPARLITCVGSYCLWTLPRDGYVHAGRVSGTLTADRTTVGVRSIALLRSPLTRQQAYLRLSLGKTSRSASQPVLSQPRPSAEDVVVQAADLERGVATASVRMPTAGVVVLSASFDPGWTARVDGRRGTCSLSRQH